MSNINPRDNLSITFPEGLLHVMDSKEQETHLGGGKSSLLWN